MNDVIEYEVKIIAKVKRTELKSPLWAEKANGEPGYEYTPQIEHTVYRDVEVYRQTFQTLDMKRVVAVVNELL